MLRPPPNSPLFPYPTLFRSANAFQIQANPGGPYNLPIYLCDAAALHDNMKVTAEGGATQTVTTLAGTFQAITLIGTDADRSEEHTSELQSQSNLVCRLLLAK